MTDLQKICKLAQVHVNRTNRPMAIVNINPFFSPKYVIRDWDDRFVDDINLVARINPEITN